MKKMLIILSVIFIILFIFYNIGKDNYDNLISNWSYALCIEDDSAMKENRRILDPALQKRFCHCYSDIFSEKMKHTFGQDAALILRNKDSHMKNRETIKQLSYKSEVRCGNELGIRIIERD